ncbi:MAG: hypothetical protein MZW92_14680 [Comamonadaceae bacterium]|nr:hypothetical protein [Comamonadaceae bacterium]
MFLVDLEQGRIIDDKELKDALANGKPYREWIERIRIKLDDLPERRRARADTLARAAARPPAGLRLHAGRPQVHPRSRWRRTARKPIGSMGNDSPLAVLSTKNKPLYSYFKQLFAQVTNPPIDPIREELVMSLVSFIGPKPNLLGIDEINPPIAPRSVASRSSTSASMEKIRHIERYTGGKFRSYELDICYPVAWGKEGDRGAARPRCAPRPRTRCARATTS